VQGSNRSQSIRGWAICHSCCRDGVATGRGIHSAHACTYTNLALQSPIGQFFYRTQELNNYLTLETKTSMIVDRSAQGELLRINFNISFPALSCEFATLDVSDALGTVRSCVPTVPFCNFLVLGVSSYVSPRANMPCSLQKRLNLTRTVRKLPINDQLERVGHYIHDDRQLDIKYDELPEVRSSIIFLCNRLTKWHVCLESSIIVSFT